MTFSLLYLLLQCPMTSKYFLWLLLLSHAPVFSEAKSLFVWLYISSYQISFRFIESICCAVESLNFFLLFLIERPGTVLRISLIHLPDIVVLIQHECPFIHQRLWSISPHPLFLFFLLGRKLIITSITKRCVVQTILICRKTRLTKEDHSK